MALPFTTRISLPKDVLMRELDGESVLLNLDTECYFGLDEVGTRMWAVLSTSESIQHAYDALLAEYDVEAGLLRRDLLDLVQKLIKHGLLEINNEEMGQG